MNVVKLKNIKIFYDDIQNQNIDYIKKVINNNYDLFLSLLGESKIISLVPTNEAGAVYISNFDKTFYEIVNQFFNNEGINDLLGNSDILSIFYIETLIRKNISKQKLLIQPNPNITDEMLYSIIAYIYFTKTGTFDDFVNYLKDKKDVNKILSWLQAEARFDAYNYLLETTVNYLKQTDFDFLSNISDIIKMMLTQLMNNDLTQQPEEEISVPLITSQKFDQLFNEFLKFINAPESWNSMYDELKSSDRICFEKQVDNLNTSMCYRDDNGIVRILVSTDGTMKDLYNFVHEFMHYISMKNSVTLSQFSISEFPSIFFEKIFARFLKDKGYKEDTVDKMLEDRNRNNIETCMELLPLFNDISTFIKGGLISKDKKVLFLENNFRAIQEIKEKIAKIVEEDGGQLDTDFLELPKIDISREVDKECDFLIDDFIQNGSLVINGYQYLLDTYLAEEVLKKSNNDNSIISRMINVTDNLGNMNLKDILIEFDIQNIMNDSKEKDDLSRKHILMKKIP